MAKKSTSKSSNSIDSAGLIKAIRSNTQKVYSSEQKILIVMEGIRAELSVSELCRATNFLNKGLQSTANPYLLHTKITHEYFTPASPQTIIFIDIFLKPSRFSSTNETNT